ncbi:hypothetical protein AACH06_10500 [Ideonella sp. DXS29W]|uniref:Uncharacterized protein n=1 Tax=Ideonella lacteola TaxID=2984193 RepID=A0ABU9BNA0_9BURK
MARRVDPDSLWSLIDAMGWLLALEGQPDDAARLAGASDAAYGRHGQHRRQPNEERARAELSALLDAALAPERLQTLQADGHHLDAHAAADLTLGPA